MKFLTFNIFIYSCFVLPFCLASYLLLIVPPWLSVSFFISLSFFLSFFLSLYLCAPLVFKCLQCGCNEGHFLPHWLSLILLHSWGGEIATKIFAQPFKIIRINILVNIWNCFICKNSYNVTMLYLVYLFDYLRKWEEHLTLLLLVILYFTIKTLLLCGMFDHGQKNSFQSNSPSLYLEHTWSDIPPPSSP